MAVSDAEFEAETTKVREAMIDAALSGDQETAEAYRRTLALVSKTPKSIQKPKK
jgi:hypothetical protein